MPFTYEYPHPAVTADVVVFTIRLKALQILLIQRGLAPFKGRWALPGGFIRMNETLERCASRELEEETGLTDIYLSQVAAFSGVDRDPRERVITVAFFALVNSEDLSPKGGSDAAAASWHRLDKLPSLAFDHAQIVRAARARLQERLEPDGLAYKLLPKEFTISELQGVYEAILGETLDRRNFRKRLLQLNLIKETKKTRRDGAHRPATLFTQA